MKAILAYIVLNYDLKIDGDGKRPANIYYANEIIPAVDGLVLFRKRQYPPKLGTGGEMLAWGSFSPGFESVTTRSWHISGGLTRGPPTNRLNIL